MTILQAAKNINIVLRSLDQKSPLIFAKSSQLLLAQFPFKKPGFYEKITHFGNTFLLLA